MAGINLGLPDVLSPATVGFATLGPDNPGPAQGTTTNTAGVMTAIAHWLVGQGQGVILVRPDRAGGPGSELASSALQVRLKLRDNSGVEVAADGRLVLSVRAPGVDQPTPLKEFSYGLWHGLTYAEQVNRDNVATLGLTFPIPGDDDDRAVGLHLPAGAALVLSGRLDRSVSFGPAAGTRLELPCRIIAGAVVM